MIDENKLIKEINECDFTADVNKLNANDNGPQLKGFYIGYTEALVRLQPQADKCSDCSRRKFYQQGYQDGLNADKWIPCSERLPKCEWGCETKALMYQLKNTDSIEVGYYGEGGKFRDRYFRTYRDSHEGVDVSDVIAWQPLPQPYKKEGAE